MSRVTMDDLLPDHCAKDVVVLCCGNVLFGDDGFGPAVAEKINASETVPDWAVVIDTGTAVRKFLFDMILSERRPHLVVVVDAVDTINLGRKPGEVFEIPLSEIPRVKVSEFSLHQAPTSNLLQELQKVGGMRVAVIACQVASIPKEITEDISSVVRAAIDRAARLITDLYLRERG
ncbi:hydrogenase maturation protease [Candidatus Bipolaricaulota bacterium]|nr:hydrogenase maturation protease [Candidatus Bipolaricaulota bacterium]